jgi:hypothetical protein
MCWKCQEIDKQIGHYQGLSARTSDEGSVKSLHILIATLEATKKEFHPELEAASGTAPPC